MTTTEAYPLVLDFGQIGLGDVGRVGGKNASLGELLGELVPLGVGVTLDEEHAPIVARRLGTKEVRLVYGGGSRGTRSEPVPERARREFSLADEDVLKLARRACLIEEHYSHRAGARPRPDGGRVPRHGGDHAPCFLKPIGICGQAPSDYPEVAARLVEHGIHSISLNPDRVVRTREIIARAEETAEPRAVGRRAR